MTSSTESLRKAFEEFIGELDVTLPGKRTYNFDATEEDWRIFQAGYAQRDKRVLEVLREIVVAMSAASLKMHTEYRYLQPDAPIDEEWSENTELRNAIEKLTALIDELQPTTERKET